MQSVIIGKNQAGQRLDKFLHKYLPQAGTGFLYKMLRKKNITLNGKRAEGSEILALEDEVRFFFSDETFARFSGICTPEKEISDAKMPDAAAGEKDADPSFVKACETAYHSLRGISVLYEDEDFVILNKPCGILAQKAAPEDMSLNEWLIGYLLEENPSLEKDLSTFRPSVCNRLDRNTSGIVLCGKSLGGLQYFGRCIRERTVRKFYRTICVGSLREKAFLEGYLVKDKRRNRVTVSETPGDKGEEAFPIRTSYVPLAVTGSYTLLEVELITGKPHQIRAHLAGMGHPLVGDYKYGLKAVNDELKRKYGLEHQLLHACRVEFPETVPGYGSLPAGKIIRAPEPPSFRALEKALLPQNETPAVRRNRGRVNGYMEFQGASRLHAGGYDQQDKRKIRGSRACADSEGSNPHHPH